MDHLEEVAHHLEVEAVVIIMEDLVDLVDVGLDQVVMVTMMVMMEMVIGEILITTTKEAFWIWN